LALRLTGRLSVVTAISINYTTALLLLGSAQYGGINSPGLTWFGLLPLVAAFFVQSPRARLATLLGIAAQAGIFFAIELVGWGLPQHVPLEALAPSGMIMRFCLGFVVWVMAAYYAGVVDLQQVALEQEVEGHHHTQHELRQATAEAQRAQALEAQLHHSQRLEALGTLAGGIAHEINNALVPIIALTKLVARKLPAESRERRSLDTVLTGAERSRDLVDRILAVSREQPPRRYERFDLAMVIAEALLLMRASLPPSVRLEPELIATAIIEGDPTQLHQVIVNLVTNAAQAIGAAAGTISVRLQQAADGERLELSVADTGCGMDEATQSRIFEPFFTTKPAPKGTGLGLAVVRNIVKEHGGAISVESAPGNGSRFEIRLPVRSSCTAVVPA
jgi:signal transduction histidine kinase